MCEIIPRQVISKKIWNHDPIKTIDIWRRGGGGGGTMGPYQNIGYAQKIAQSIYG